MGEAVNGGEFRRRNASYMFDVMFLRPSSHFRSRDRPPFWLQLRLQSGVSCVTICALS